MIETLRAAAVEFLRYDRQCKLVSLERSPVNYDPCTPDVVGVNATRRVVEIEIKKTWADFKNNRKKDSMFRRKFLKIPVSQYYFLVPGDLVAKVYEALEPGEGLLTLGAVNPMSGIPKIKVIKPASTQRVRKLTIKETIKMVAHQTGTLASALTKVVKLKNELEELRSSQAENQVSQ